MTKLPIIFIIYRRLSQRKHQSGRQTLDALLKNKLNTLFCSVTCLRKSHNYGQRVRFWMFCLTPPNVAKNAELTTKNSLSQQPQSVGQTSLAFLPCFNITHIKRMFYRWAYESLTKRYKKCKTVMIKLPIIFIIYRRLSQRKYQSGRQTLDALLKYVLNTLFVQWLVYEKVKIRPTCEILNVLFNVTKCCRKCRIYH